MAKRTAGSRRKPRDLGDVAVVVGRTEDNEGLQILRRRGEEEPVELGTLRPLKEGQPIGGEVISLKPRRAHPFLCDVKVELPQQEIAGRPTSDGPAQVASDEYRSGWDAIWGGRASGARGRAN